MVCSVSDKAGGESGVEASTYDVVRRVEDLEREVNRLKALTPFRLEMLKPASVSFRGSAKLLVSMDELETGIEEAKAASFRYEL